MDLGKTFGVDKTLAEQGVTISVDGDGSTITVAALPNAAYDRHMEPVFRRYREMQKPVPESEFEAAVARHVLLGWENLTDGGQPLEPTEENRLSMLRKYSQFKALVRNEATLRANFQRRAAEAEIKNSATGPSTPSESAQS